MDGDTPGDHGLAPVLGSLALVLHAAARRPRQRGRSRLRTALVTLAVSLVLLAGFDSDAAGPQFAFSSSRCGH